MLKILHIAPQNHAGVYYDYYKMHNQSGDFSRLITFHKTKFNYPEDICLNIPLPQNKFANYWRLKKVIEVENSDQKTLKYFKPKNFLEKIYFEFRDWKRKPIFEEVIKEYKLNEFDIIHYDTGMDFYRDCSQAKKWKKEGKKIVCCYDGVDLRIRGIFKELDEISDLNITSEYDHLKLKDDLIYFFYPFDTSQLPNFQIKNNKKVVIVHSPTNRKYKGTDLILSVIDKIKDIRKIDFKLLENVPHAELLRIKQHADICIDQVGGSYGAGTGYGKAGLETLAMGIPTITNMTDEYRNWLPENPFVVANNAQELYDVLIKLIDSPDLRYEIGMKGMEWVEKYHGFKNVNDKLKELYKQKGII